MAEQVRTFEITVAPGSTRAAPVTTEIGFEPFRVVSIEVEVPPGPLGQVGFQIASSNVQLIPWNLGEWIVANNITKKWETDNYPTSGDWQFIAYNTGAFPHTLSVTFELDPIAPAGPAPVAVTPMDLSTIPAGAS